MCCDQKLVVLAQRDDLGRKACHSAAARDGLLGNLPRFGHETRDLLGVLAHPHDDGGENQDADRCHRRDDQCKTPALDVRNDERGNHSNDTVDQIHGAGAHANLDSLNVCQQRCQSTRLVAVKPANLLGQRRLQEVLAHPVTLSARSQRGAHGHAKQRHTRNN